MRMIAVFLLSIVTVMADDHTEDKCPETKNVGGKCYQRKELTDTSAWGCEYNCTYTTEDGGQYCFKAGPLPVTNCTDNGTCMAIPLGEFCLITENNCFPGQPLPTPPTCGCACLYPEEFEEELEEGRPDVQIYNSDTKPINCTVYYGNSAACKLQNQWQIVQPEQILEFGPRNNCLVTEITGSYPNNGLNNPCQSFRSDAGTSDTYFKVSGTGPICEIGLQSQ